MARVEAKAEHNMAGMAIGRSLGVWLGTVLLAVASLAGGPRAAALAGERPNLMIVGEDADRSSVQRGSRIFNRVLVALADEMLEQGFKVYDETAAGMQITWPGRVRRTDAELITIARSIQRPPIDVILIFQIYASAQPIPHSETWPRVRIAGRLIQVQTSRALGSFELAVGPGGLRPLPRRCYRDCLLERVGDEAKPIAHAVGAALALKLDALMTTGPGGEAADAPLPGGGAGASCDAYTVVLSGFDGDELLRIERQLAAFEGYKHHKLLHARRRGAPSIGTKAAPTSPGSSRTCAHCSSRWAGRAGWR
jgi:hypothetical protein